MTKINFDIECDKIIDTMNLKRYEQNKKKILKNAILRYIDNGTTLKEKQYILNLVKNISWYWNTQISDYFCDVINKYFNRMNTLIIDYTDEKKKSPYSNSTAEILHCLSNSGIIMDDEFVKIEDLKTIPNNITTLILIDDFIGSGNSIIKQIKRIDDMGIKNKKIMILSYICHIVGKQQIEDYRSKNELFLYFEKLENSYLYKGMEKDLIRYINKICQRCKKNELRYGYGECGSMVSINFVSPNNNLSMLYGKNIDDWDSLLDRNLNLIVLHERKIKLLSRNQHILRNFYNNNFQLKLTFDEFKLLLLIYNCSGISEELLKEFHFCATIDDVNELIDSLRIKNILSNQYYLSIIDRKILRKLRTLDDSLSEDYTKKKSIRFY